jgi:hypothetical protein
MYNRQHTENKMTFSGSTHAVTGDHYARRLALFLLLFAAALPLVAQDRKESSGQQSSGDNDSVGFNLGKNASAKDVGLPIYPGARRHKEDANDSSAVNMGLWGGSTGFKLFVLKMESTDAPEKVASFYRKALAQYGPVLDCSSASSVGNAHDDKSSKKLTCEGEKPKPGEISLKTGSKAKEHAVGIEPSGSGTVFELVYIETKGTD